MKYKCCMCGMDFSIGGGFSNHLKATHSIKIEKYFEQFPEQVQIYKELKEANKINFQKGSPNSIHFYLSKGMSQEEAERTLTQYRKEKGAFNKPENRMCNLEWYTSRGYTLEEAIEQRKLFQSNSLESLIKKHGEEEGRRRYENIKATMATRPETEIVNLMAEFNCSREEAMEIRNKRYADCSPRTEGYWTLKGFSPSEAKSLVSLHQKRQSKRSVEYWIHRGYSEEQAKEMVSESQDFGSVSAIVKRYNCTEEEAEEIRQERIQKTLISKFEKGLYSGDEKAYRAYKTEVVRLTEMTWRKHKETLNPNNLERGNHTYHLDHKFSILHGFLADVPEEIMACVHNLQLITAEQNISKSVNSDIELDTLMELYESTKELKESNEY